MRTRNDDSGGWPGVCFRASAPERGLSLPDGKYTFGAAKGLQRGCGEAAFWLLEGWRLFDRASVLARCLRGRGVQQRGGACVRYEGVKMAVLEVAILVGRCVLRLLQLMPA